MRSLSGHKHQLRAPHGGSTTARNVEQQTMQWGERRSKGLGKGKRGKREGD